MRWLSVFALILFSINARAYFQADLLKGKKGPGQAEQWTLADWLSQKKSMRLADQWLAMHTNKQLLDLTLSGGSTQYTYRTSNGGTTTSASQTSVTTRLDMNISIFNISGDYEKTNNSLESYGGALGLRLFGASNQSTSLVARYGYHRLNDLSSGEHWDNPYLDGQLNLYIISEFGLSGDYRYYFPKTSNLGNELSGTEWTAGAFLDFLIFRLYGNYFQEPLQITNGSATNTQSRYGFEAGVKLVF